MFAGVLKDVVVPQHVLRERDQMPHQCTQHEHLVQVPKK